MKDYLYFETILYFIIFSTILFNIEVVAQENSPNSINLKSDTPSVTETNTTQLKETKNPGIHKVKIIFFEKGTGNLLKRTEVKAGDQKLFSDSSATLELTIQDDTVGEIVISRKGYQKQIINSDILLQNDELKVFLVPKLNDDQIVRVKGERRINVSRKTIAIDESKKIAPGGDPTQVIKLLPGVQKQGFGSDVIIRGSGPEDSKFYIDNIEVPFVFHSVGNISIIPTEYLDDVVFESGGFGSEYGDATGGIIKITTSKEIPKKSFTTFTLNLPLYSGGYHIQPISYNESIAASYRRSYLDFFIQEILDQMAEKGKTPAPTVTPMFQDAHLFYTNKNNAGYTKYTFLSAQDGFEALIPTNFSSNEEGVSELNVNNQFYSFGIEKLIRLNSSNKIMTTPQFFHLKIDNNFFGNKVKLNIYRFQVPFEFVSRLDKNRDFAWGVEYTNTQAVSDIFAVIPDLSDPTFDMEDAEMITLKSKQYVQDLALWAFIDFVFFENTKISPGLRVDYNSTIDKTNLDPRIRFKHQFSKNHDLKGAVGQYSKKPEPRESSDGYGNINLNYEQSKHYILGLESRWTDFWSTEIQFFNKVIDGVILNDNEFIFLNKGKIISKGAEFFIRRNLSSRLFGWISYTYSKSEIMKSKEGDFTFTDYDQPHVLNFASSYKFNSQWELGTRYSYSTGKPYTPISNAVYNASIDKYQPRPDASLTNSKRLPITNSLTLYATKEFLLDTYKWVFKFGLESFWIKEPVVAVSNNFDFTEESYSNGLLAIPFLELRGEF